MGENLILEMALLLLDSQSLRVMSSLQDRSIDCLVAGVVLPAIKTITCKTADAAQRKSF